ncbi:MAG: hypothetical protein JJ895_07020 [Balneolaceae bacterium]|nr:hypothetical protein [Balneolaceae bacterium]
MSHFFNELKRRDVFRVATAYTVSSWLIIQIVVSIFPYIGIDDFWITTIIVLLIIGFPIAVIGGWIYEMTPDGIRKTDEVEVSEAFEEYSDRKLNRIIIGVLATVILFMLVERVFFAEGSIIERDTLQVQTASVAVLPFVDMSENQDQEYFSDGLSEELLNVLAKVEGLQVAGRTSSFQYKGQNIDLRLVGEDLGVDHILEGSVRKFGDQIRITAQLIKADDGFHVWSETYTREYSANNLFDIQDEISSQVLQELQIRLIPEKESQLQKNLTSNTEAYDLYLRATQLLVNRNANEIEKAIELFDEAIALDADFAAAYARQAIAYHLLSFFGSMNSKDLKTIMRSNIDKALLIDGNLGWAYAALGLYYQKTSDYEAAGTAFERAYELIPGDPEIMIWYSPYAGDPELTSSLIERAYKTDPYSPIVIDKYARQLYLVDRFDEAVDLMEKNIRLNPGYSMALSLKAEFIKDQPFGQLDEAFKLSYQAYKNEPANLSYMQALAELSFDLGFLNIVEEMIREMERYYPENAFYITYKQELHYYRSEYEDMLEAMKEFQEKENVTPQEWYFLENYMRAYIGAGWYEQGYDYVKEYYPSIINGEYNPAQYLTYELSFLSILFDRLGNEAKANELKENACLIATGWLQNEEDPDSEIVQDVFDYMDCLALNKNKAEFLRLLEQTHFERNSKANLYEFLDANPIYDFIKDDPDYIALRSRMEADIDSMRQNAIEWMKENGEWNSDWEVFVYDFK